MLNAEGPLDTVGQRVQHGSVAVFGEQRRGSAFSFVVRFVGKP